MLGKLPSGFHLALEIIYLHVRRYFKQHILLQLPHSDNKIESKHMVFQQKWDELAFWLAKQRLSTTAHSGNTRAKVPALLVICNIVRLLSQPMMLRLKWICLVTLPKTLAYLSSFARRNISHMVVERVTHGRLPSELREHILRNLLAPSHVLLKDSLESSPVDPSFDSHWRSIHAEVEPRQPCAAGRARYPRCCCAHHHCDQVQVHRWDGTQRNYVLLHADEVPGKKISCSIRSIR